MKSRKGKIPVFFPVSSELPVTGLAANREARSISQIWFRRPGSRPASNARINDVGVRGPKGMAGAGVRLPAPEWSLSSSLFSA
jgi:hypothetical protein